MNLVEDQDLLRRWKGRCSRLLVLANIRLSSQLGCRFGCRIRSRLACSSSFPLQLFVTAPAVQQVYRAIHRTFSKSSGNGSIQKGHSTSPRSFETQAVRESVDMVSMRFHTLLRQLVQRQARQFESDSRPHVESNGQPHSQSDMKADSRPHVESDS
jgi:hypothetical protein